MYGISTKAFKGSEEHIIKVMQSVERATVAVESLSDILSNVEGRTEMQLQEAGQRATAIMRTFELNGIATEAVFTRDNFDAARTTVTEFVLKLIALIRNAIEYYHQLLTEFKHGAKRLRARSATVIGAGATVSGSIKTGKMIEGIRIFNNLNIRGQIPADLDSYLQRVTKAARDLEDSDFVSALSAVVTSAKMGQDHTAKRDAFENNLRRNLQKAYKTPVAELSAMDSASGHPSNFSSELYPGNTGILVYMPAVNDGMETFRCTIVSNPDYRNRQQLVKTLAPKDIENIGRTVRVFCEYVLSQRDMQSQVNQISREINAMARAGNMRDVGKSIAPFAKMIKSPAIMQMRLALTLCSRAITYCESSINAYDAQTGV